MEFDHENAANLRNYFESEYSQGKKWFAYAPDSVIKGKWDVNCFSSHLDALQYAHDNTSAWEIIETGYVTDAIYHLKNILNIKTAQNEDKHIQYSKSITSMNTQNLEFLQSSLKYFGFGDKLNEELKKNIEQQKGEFQLHLQIPHFNNKMDYTLHFKKSDSTEMYFFNRMDAKLQNGKPEEEKSQSFYVNKGNGITAKEAFNLLEGRSVFKDLVNKEGQKYSAWLKLDFENADDKGNHKLKQFNEHYGYDLEKTLGNFPIKELANPEQKKQLLQSLEKGNVQQVTMKQGEKDLKFFIEAVPQFKNINVYDQKMHAVRRQNVQIFGKSESTGEKASQKQAQKKNADPVQPKQKQSRKRKLSLS